MGFINSAPHFVVVLRPSIRKVKLFNSECQCSLNRRNGVVLGLRMTYSAQ